MTIGNYSVYSPKYLWRKIVKFKTETLQTVPNLCEVHSQAVPVRICARCAIWCNKTCS